MDKNILPEWPPCLVTFDKLPSWQQENEYVQSGYRSTSGSLRASALSLLYFHNESINIYSHLVGAALFAALPLALRGGIVSPARDADDVDITVLVIYAIGVAVCFTLSAFCHLVWNCTPSWAVFGTQLDYLGIILLMWGASVPTVYFGFYCDQMLQRCYWSLMTGAAAACAAATLDARFSHRRFRLYRAALFSCLALLAVVFISHGLMRYGWDIQKLRMSLKWMILMGLLNATGAAIYAVRFPERWHPLRFDCCGASHQIFHIMVVLAALTHLAGLLSAMSKIHSSSLTC